jgi:hypothetical protein
LRNPVWKNPSQKRAGVVAQSVDPEFKSQYRKKKKKGFFFGEFNQDIHYNQNKMNF